MTFVGKILVVVQMILSVCFMAFAGAVYSFQEDWQNAYNTSQNEVTKLSNELNEANDTIRLMKADRDADKGIEVDLAKYLQEADFDALTAHIADPGVSGQLKQLASDLAAAEVELLRVNEALADANEELKNQKEEFSQLQVKQDIKQQEAKERAIEAQKYKEINAKLNEELNQAVVKQQDLRDQIFSKDTQLKQVAARQSKLLEEMANYVQAVNQAGIDIDEFVAASEPPPAVSGKVVRTRKSDGGVVLVEITIGSDDGIAKGHVLDVYNTDGRGKYLGQIQILYTTPDAAVGRVVDEVRNGKIRENDDVTTKL